MVDQQDIQFTLGKMTGQLDVILKTIESYTADHKNLQTRVTEIEGKISKALGVFSVFTIFAGAASTYIWKKVIG